MPNDPNVVGKISKIQLPSGDIYELAGSDAANIVAGTGILIEEDSEGNSVINATATAYYTSSNNTLNIYTDLSNGDEVGY